MSETEIIGISQRLQKIRTARGQSRPQVAKETGIAVNTIARWENGGGDAAGAFMLGCLAQYYGVSMDFIVYGDGKKNKPGTKKTLKENHEAIKSTLCWSCQRSYKPALKCSWARNYIPVKGWEAEYKPIHYYHYGDLDSYCVMDCPLYMEDEPKKGGV